MGEQDREGHVLEDVPGSAADDHLTLCQDRRPLVEGPAIAHRVECDAVLLRYSTDRCDDALGLSFGVHQVLAQNLGWEMMTNYAAQEWLGDQIQGGHVSAQPLCHGHCYLDARRGRRGLVEIDKH